MKLGAFSVSLTVKYRAASFELHKRRSLERPIDHVLIDQLR
ncbi:hypothetical protein CLV85_1104 [Salinibacterium amurskyense]|uniref:Uncharacterized protein n=1 Tax=Salinibacterium amurskyense TaxID=205941 RepID=A0A2M9D874_9MICO|nr:hypothetical protein [Salinibacterium amurskyense]PJJ81919.1 hypothetical protein CLV85_1104 [Salinibacterium amurskyense]